MGKNGLVIIGHRGAKGLAPENTLASLKKALEHGVDEIEFDVRVTKDDVAILSHDPAIHNAAGEAFEITAHTFAQLKKQNPDLTTLDEALDFIDAKRPVVIEVKPETPLEPIVTSLNKYLSGGTYSARDFRLASFDYRLLCELHREFPDITKVVNESWSGVRATWRAHRLDTKRVTMRSWWLWGGFISSLAKRGWQLSTYTLNDTAKAHAWARHGLWGVVTDYPDNFERKDKS